MKRVVVEFANMTEVTKFLSHIGDLKFRSIQILNDCEPGAVGEAKTPSSEKTVPLPAYAAPRLETTQAFLTAIRGAGRNGIGGEELAAALGLDHVSKLGSVVADFNRHVTEMNFEPSEVAEGRRSKHGRRWYSGQRIDEVIREIMIADL